jgi:hypothetical protein
MLIMVLILQPSVNSQLISRIEVVFNYRQDLNSPRVTKDVDIQRTIFRMTVKVFSSYRTKFIFGICR